MSHTNSIKKILSHKFIDEVKLRKYIKKLMIPLGPEVWTVFLKGGHSDEYTALVEMSFNHNNSYTPSEDILIFIKNNNLPFFHQLEINKKIFHQIQIDIKRLNPRHVKIGNQDISKSYQNILLLISHRRYNLGYVQGMADFLVPFLQSCPEYQAYFLYLDLIKKIEFNIINLQGNLILRFRETMENIDPVLCTYLSEIGLEFHVFSFRWFNCLFFREFKYEEYLKIFTFILAHKNINNILIYIAVGILSILKSDIIRQGYNDNVLMIQDLNNRKGVKVEKILEIAKRLYKCKKL